MPGGVGVHLVPAIDLLYCDSMKNITVSVDDELYHRARVRAAEQRSSLSALVRRFLIRLVEEEPAFERLERQQNEAIARIRAAHPGFAAGQRLGRDELYEQDRGHPPAGPGRSDATG